MAVTESGANLKMTAAGGKAKHTEENQGPGTREVILKYSGEKVVATAAETMLF